MDAARLTSIAEHAGARYNLVLHGFAGVFAHHVQDPNPGADRTRQRATARAYLLAEAYLSDEIAQLNAALEEVRLDAADKTVSALGLSFDPTDETARDHIDQHARELENALRVQLERDIAGVTRGLREAALRVRLMGRGRGISQQHALVALRANGTLSPSFFYVDRAGRRWPSQKLVRTLYRHALVLGWNETALIAMSERGATEAEVRHPDPKHAELGTRISLIETPGAITWDMLRDDVFHPNSEAWLLPVNSQS